MITRNGEEVAEARAGVSWLKAAAERASTAVVLELEAGDVIQLWQSYHSAGLVPLTDDMLIFTGFLL